MSTKKWIEENKEKIRKAKRDYYYRHREEMNKASNERFKKKVNELKIWFESEIKSKAFCLKCNENESICLDYHHINPEEKDMTVSRMIHDGYSKERVIDEIEKCVVLCANCHRKFHGGLFKLPDNDTIESPIID